MSNGPFDVTIRVAEVTAAESFPEAEKPGMVKLRLSLGDESRRSAAQLARNHDPEELVGTQVLCVTDLGTVRIAGFESEALTVGVPDEDGNPVLVAPTKPVPNGGALY